MASLGSARLNPHGLASKQSQNVDSHVEVMVIQH